MSVFKVSNSVLCEFLIPSSAKNAENLASHLKITYGLDPDTVQAITEKLNKSFMTTFKNKWKTAFYNQVTFNENNKKWLQSDFEVNLSKKPVKFGRPSLTNCEDASYATKRRRILTIEEQYSAAEIEQAYLRILKSQGRKDIVQVLMSMLSGNYDETTINDINPYTSEEAVAFVEDAKLSKYQYQFIQMQANARNAKLYPSYAEMASARNDCYPLNISVSESGASIQLQALIDHTVQRLLKDPSITLPATHGNEIPLTLIIKWGCDGSSGNSEYKQLFNDKEISDATTFMISMVPLCLRVDGEESSVLWNNPRPSSTKYCRPIKFEYEKETKEKTQDEVSSIKEEIKNLLPTKIETNNGTYLIGVDMHVTMVDGKVCQALTDTPSAATCIICKCTPIQMNQLNIVQRRTIITEHAEFGLSTLHAWIRFMQCILNISYRLDFCTWAVKTEDDKTSMIKQKNEVQTKFRTRTGLIVDVPRQGSGTSNDGNTARRFFRDPEVTAEITKVDVRLIKRFSIILQALACGRKINSEAFGRYAFQTAELYVQLYPWYYMPASVHKILLHGQMVIESFLLPIGQMSEEAAEARNKDFKRFRQFNTRKCSRIATNTDLMHKLLASSDPYVACLRGKWKKCTTNVDSECEELLESADAFDMN